MIAPCVYLYFKTSLTILYILDDSFDDEVDDDLSEVQRVITTNSESNFQRKITVSQTQL